jgi:NAD(P)-dependent dehydrogenase (short-subunit alcohol dehydrogenase family)
MSDSMRDRVCVVTGANRGMGKITAGELARRGATVILVCRNRERGEAALDDIVQATGNDAVELVIADLAALRQVCDAAEEITGRHDEVHVLVNNAGVFLGQRGETEDGFEQTFATNHLGHFLLTELLLDALKAGAPSRIVNVTARTGRYRIDFDDIGFTRRKYSTISAASQSKLAMLMATVELARQLAGTGVTANAVYPGLVKTGITKELPAAVRTLLNVISTTPEKGARTTIHVATSPELESVSGQFFGPKQKQLRLPAQAQDAAARRRLWDVSARMTERDQVPV